MHASRRAMLRSIRDPGSSSLNSDSRDGWPNDIPGDLVPPCPNLADDGGCWCIGGHGGGLRGEGGF